MEEEKLEPESSDPLAQLGGSVQESCRTKETAAPNDPVFQGPSAHLTDEDFQAFLHSKKEQKRRMQIKECCSRLRELMPFVRSRMDTASTLEMTVKYMTYLRQWLPEDILEKVIKGLEETRTG
ncbi:hypothetical protein JZ751_002195, partial [Albula glossodonta]